jgi:hypothetical protein
MRQKKVARAKQEAAECALYLLLVHDPILEKSEGCN